MLTRCRVVAGGLDKLVLQFGAWRGVSQESSTQASLLMYLLSVWAGGCARRLPIATGGLSARGRDRPTKVGLDLDRGRWP